LERNSTETETNKETTKKPRQGHTAAQSHSGVCTLSANEHTRWNCGHVTNNSPRIAAPLPPCSRSAIGVTEDTALLLGACQSCRSAHMGSKHLAPKLAHRSAEWASALTTADQAAMSDSFTPHSLAPTHIRPRTIAATHIQRHWQPAAAHFAVTTTQSRTQSSISHSNNTTTKDCSHPSAAGPKTKPQHNLA
jgi:hypothetical protein